MKSSKGHQEEEEDDYEEFGVKKDNTPSFNTSKGLLSPLKLRTPDRFLSNCISKQFWVSEFPNFIQLC